MVSVLNHDIAGLHARINRFIEEVYKSVSSGISDFTQFDQDRVLSYLEAVDTYHNWVVDQPQLDLPESHPKVIELEANPEVQSIENESINDVIRMMEVAREEIVNSQSARNPAGLNKFDSARLTANVSKIRAFMIDYVGPITPLDLPESSPQEATSGSGKKGI